MPAITNNAAILAAARSAIEVLLEFKGFPTVLIPRLGDGVAKPGGGRDFPRAAPRPSQPISLAAVADSETYNDEDTGRVRTRTYTLTGRWNMAIAIGDQWEDDEASYTVQTIDASSGFKTSAEVLGYIK